MRLHELLAITLSLIQFPVLANIDIYQIEFGVIIQNENGEPVGFEKTKLIPISYLGQSSLYGLVVTSSEQEEFTLNSVHTLPNTDGDDLTNKIIGKPMLIQKRGAIFLRTDESNKPGQYTMEVFINNKLHDVIQYELTAQTNLSKL